MTLPADDQAAELVMAILDATDVTTRSILRGRSPAAALHRLIHAIQSLQRDLLDADLKTIF